MKKATGNGHFVKITVPEGRFCAKCPYLEGNRIYCSRLQDIVSENHRQAYCFTNSNNVDRESLNPWTICPYY